MTDSRLAMALSAILALGMATGCASGGTGTDAGPGGDDGGGSDAGPGDDDGGGSDAGPDAAAIDSGPDLCDGVDCSDLDDDCNLGECDPSSGACMVAPVTDGTTCDDSDMCTETDVCTAGVCAGSALDCSAMSGM